jgi:predicted nucleotide-binding protein (sugar kinase/HSP70/actin superfamily)
MTTIGIPRALLYYQYYPMWKTFFEHLGAEVVISEPTSRTTLVNGTARVVADTCLPVKIFVGHVLSLVDKCDCIFIPAIRSLKSRTYNCSKFLGLPDMTRAVVPESPPILEIEIDVNRGKRHLYQAIYGLGRRFRWNPLRVRDASMAAMKAFINYRGMMSGSGLTPLQVIDDITDAPRREPDEPSIPSTTPSATIAIIGHAYLLYDEHINYKLIHRLEQYGVRVLTPEMLTEHEQETAVARLVGRAYWTYEEEVVGAGGYYLQNKADGVIGVMAFGCGPDSLMMEILRREAGKQQTTAFMCITLEEHTSETGVITRLEAFLDMIHRRKRRRVAVCA